MKTCRIKQSDCERTNRFNLYQVWIDLWSILELDLFGFLYTSIALFIVIMLLSIMSIRMYAVQCTDHPLPHPPWHLLARKSRSLYLSNEYRDLLLELLQLSYVLMSFERGRVFLLQVCWFCALRYICLESWGFVLRVWWLYPLSFIRLESWAKFQNGSSIHWTPQNSIRFNHCKKCQMV